MVNVIRPNFGKTVATIHGVNRRYDTLDGLPILNATKSVVLHITDKDIKSSKKRSNNACAAAKACMRQMKVSDVRVHLGRVYVKKAATSKHWVRYLTSPTLRREIVAFDRGGSFEPGEYKLSKIVPSKATGKKVGKDGYKPTGKRKRSRSYILTPNVRATAVQGG